MTAFSSGLDSICLVWGDRFTGADHPRNVYDFRSLTDRISKSRTLASRAGVNAIIFAPVNVSSAREGLERGRNRLDAGADFLLAQPPTTDSALTFGAHSSKIKDMGIVSQILLGVFPFRDTSDVEQCTLNFGWTLPARLFEIAALGETGLASEAREVIRLAERQGLRGVYLSTRGRPEVALPMLSRRRNVTKSLYRLPETLCRTGWQKIQR